MELKPEVICEDGDCIYCLNRTFYGIETRIFFLLIGDIGGLNRTFYGIETGDIGQYGKGAMVS